MARVSKVESNKLRKKLADRYMKRRQEYKKVIIDEKAAPEARYEAGINLQKLPKNSCPVRYRNRCVLTGRPRAVYRKFGLSRIQFRELALKGMIPGVTKSSW